MSGPKTSHYTLTAEQRRIMMEQREIQRTKQRLTEQRKEIRAELSKIEGHLQQLRPIVQEVSEDTSALMETEQLCTRASGLMQQAVQIEPVGTLDSLHNMERKLAQSARELKKAEMETKKNVAIWGKQFQSAMTEKIAEGFQASLDFGMIGSEKPSDDGSHSIIDAAISEISQLLISEEQRKRALEIQNRAMQIEDESFLKNFYAVTIVPFLKQCRSYAQEYELYGEAYEKENYDYHMNSEKLGVEAEYIPFSREAVRELECRNRMMEEEIQKRDEQQYISACVDEAMEEMGYELLGDRQIVKRSGKRFKNTLYTFGEGTAVNVTYASDGQITMELGGLSEEDRIPTLEESNSLAEDMQSFCDDFREIETILKKKGIVSKHIMMLPPDAQYAQIINASDYQLRTEITEYEANSRKRNVVENKVQRVDE